MADDKPRFDSVTAAADNLKLFYTALRDKAEEPGEKAYFDLMAETSSAILRWQGKWIPMIGGQYAYYALLNFVSAHLANQIQNTLPEGYRLDPSNVQAMFMEAFLLHYGSDEKIGSVAFQRLDS